MVNIFALYNLYSCFAPLSLLWGEIFWCVRNKQHCIGVKKKVEGLFSPLCSWMLCKLSTLHLPSSFPSLSFLWKLKPLGLWMWWAPGDCSMSKLLSRAASHSGWLWQFQSCNYLPHHNTYRVAGQMLVVGFLYTLQGKHYLVFICATDSQWVLRKSKLPNSVSAWELSLNTFY